MLTPLHERSAAMWVPLHWEQLYSRMTTQRPSFLDASEHFAKVRVQCAVRHKE